MTVPVNYREFVSLETWEAMPESDLPTEVEEGVLRVSPRSPLLHQRAINRLQRQLEDQLPVEISALGEVEVIIQRHLLTVRVPDVIAVRSELVRADTARLNASDVLLAIEVLSPGSGRHDRVLKFNEYAESGIAHYWLVEIDGPPRLRAFALSDNGYELVGEFTDQAALTVAGHSVELNISGIISR